MLPRQTKQTRTTGRPTTRQTCGSPEPPGTGVERRRGRRRVRRRPRRRRLRRCRPRLAPRPPSDFGAPAARRSASGSTALSSSSASIASTSAGGPRWRRRRLRRLPSRGPSLSSRAPAATSDFSIGVLSFGERISKSSTWNEPRALTTIRFCSRFSISSRNDAVGRLQHLGDVGVDLDQHRVALDQIALPAQLAQDLVGHRAPRLRVALALAGGARLGQRVQQRLARPLARHLDEARARRCASPPPWTGRGAGAR